MLKIGEMYTIKLYLNKTLILKNWNHRSPLKKDKYGSTSLLFNWFFSFKLLLPRNPVDVHQRTEPGDIEHDCSHHLPFLWPQRVLWNQVYAQDFSPFKRCPSRNWEKYHRKPPNQNDRQKHTEVYSNQKTKDTMAVLIPHLSIITLGLPWWCSA